MRNLPFVFVVACLPVLPAAAQSVGAPSVAGYNSLSCGTGVSPCFIQYGSILPVAGTITATFSTASISVSIVPQTGAGFGIAPAGSTAAESGRVYCTAACNLYSIEFTSLTATFTGYAMIFDATSVPSNGAVVPKHCWPVPALGSIARDFRPVPESYTTGVAVAFSNNSAGCFTLTASANAFFSGDTK